MFAKKQILPNAKYSAMIIRGESILENYSGGAEVMAFQNIPYIGEIIVLGRE